MSLHIYEHARLSAKHSNMHVKQITEEKCIATNKHMRVYEKQNGWYHCYDFTRNRYVLTLSDKTPFLCTRNKKEALKAIGLQSEPKDTK